MLFGGRIRACGLGGAQAKTKRNRFKIAVKLLNEERKKLLELLT